MRLIEEILRHSLTILKISCLLANRAATVVFFAAWLACTGVRTSVGAEITIACGGLGVEFTLCRQGAQAWAAKAGHSIKTVSLPNSSTERLALYLQFLASRADDIDVFQVDVIWPGLLSEHFLDLKPYLRPQELEAHFPALINNDTINGRLVAMPWFTDAGVLYYRRDLLKRYGATVPETWAELEQTAARIQKQERLRGIDDMWGWVWQGAPYEGLTCNALEWLLSYGSAGIVDQLGTITVNTPEAREALSMAAGWVGSISPTGVLNYDEEKARGVFQSGRAVFMRNWPYAWALAQNPDSPIRGKVGIAPLPKGGDAGQHTAVLGGWHLAISRYSAHPEVAVSLVRYLTSELEQKRRAIEGAYNPTIMSLYDDQDVIAKNAFMASLYNVFAMAESRPADRVGQKYNRVSYSFWTATHQVLSGAVSEDQSLDRLTAKLKRYRGGSEWH